MRFFDIFRRKRFDDARRSEFVDAVAGILEVQIAVSGRSEIPALATEEGVKALGYVYGFVDAALRTIGQDMSDMSLGVPIMFHVLRRVFPGSEEKCLAFLSEKLGNDQALMRGMMLGGQQYLDYIGGELAAPMGLARCLLASASTDPGGTDAKWDAVLTQCDLLAARDEIAYMHRIVNAEAKQEGGEYYFRKEYVAAWEAFRDDPSVDTARDLLDVAPPLVEYFKNSSPGGADVDKP